MPLINDPKEFKEVSGYYGLYNLQTQQMRELGYARDIYQKLRIHLWKLNKGKFNNHWVQKEWVRNDPFEIRIITQKNTGLSLSDKDLKRFWSKVRKDSSCWLWTGTCSGSRPIFPLRNKIYMASRIAYALKTGNEPASNLFKTCGTNFCVNPSCHVDGPRPAKP